MDQSFKLNPNDPNSSYGLLIIAKGLGYPKDIMEQYYQNGIKHVRGIMDYIHKNLII